MRIVRLANFITPHSGGLRTALRELGAGYAAAGHEPVLVIPGAADDDEQTPQGRVITLRGPVLPLSGGYRLLLSKRRVRDLLESLRPDRLEVSDRTTLRWTGPWARRHDVPAYARVYRAGRLGEAAAWRWLRRIHNAADRTLAPSAASATSLREHGVQRVWLWGRGVDTERFDPARRSPRLRHELAPGGELIVGYIGRLAPEKRVDLLRQVAELPGVRLVIVGDGPARPPCAGPCPGPCSSGPGTAPTWPRSTPAWTCSCTAGPARRSARRCRRRRRAVCRWSRRPQGGRSTWWKTG